jgi:hypothetical protein
MAALKINLEKQVLGSMGDQILQHRIRSCPIAGLIA